MAKVIIGMSGGVDSSVSAYLLKKQGHEVTAFFMKNWDDEECPAALDFEDVVSVCHKLEIPYYTINFVKEYKEQVFKDFLEQSQKGRTPNPDILCNKEIKFKAFFEKAKELGADFLATGHYCQIGYDKQHFYLKKGLDKTKDQSYFLYTISEKVLAKVLFPIGHLLKTKVREIASEQKLVVASKKDSTGICFIGKRNFRPFLAEHIPTTPGFFETLTGEKMGTHLGLAYYTIGQRKGLNIGGLVGSSGQAWFVVGKDLERNVITVAQGIDHPALYKSKIIASDLSFVQKNAIFSLPYTCKAKIRYRQEEQTCQILSLDKGKVEVVFEKPQRAITPGQSIVFYKQDICLGGAIIDQAE